MDKKGRLILVPALLGGEDPLEVIPQKPLDQIRSLTSFIAENAKTARRIMKLIQMNNPFSDITIREIEKHNKHQDFNYYFEDLRKGNDTGLLSEAGMPGIADPGAEFVKQAHKEGIKVIPLTGPSSIFLALAASGLNGQGFSFNGYLPKDKSEKMKSIQYYESLAKKNVQTQIFIETPYRSQQLFEDFLKFCNGNTLLCVASSITTPLESIKTCTIDQWKQQKININKLPVVFLIL